MPGATEYLAGAVNGRSSVLFAWQMKRELFKVFAISPEQVRRLDDVGAVPMGFPHDLLAGVVRGSLFGGMRDRIIA